MSRATLKIEIQVDCADWEAKWPDLQRESRAMLRRAFGRRDLLGVPPGGEVALVFADDERLKALNFQFRGKRQSTNVLSFPDPDIPLGGIAIAFETVKQEAQEQGKSFVNHSKHMILHGFLHLLGYDHIKPRAARLMEGLEITILSDMSISNPYLLEGKERG